MRIDTDALLAPPDLTAHGWTETVNEVVVRFRNRDRAWQTDALTWRNPAVYAVTGRPLTQAIECDWITDPAVAWKVAMAYGKSRSLPWLDGRLRVRRGVGADLRPGDTVSLTYAHSGIDAVRFRVLAVEVPDANETKLPRVLLIGDSITGGYGPKVEEALKGKASVARLTTSKSIGDPVLLTEVALVLGQCHFDVVRFNSGLHGSGYSEEEYRQQFPELVATIRKHAAQAKLIWATTTPVRQAGNLNAIAEETKQVEARNKIADGIVARERIAVNDLFGLVKDHPEWWSADGVHFNAMGIAAQAAQGANRITDALP